MWYRSKYLYDIERDNLYGVSFIDLKLQNSNAQMSSDIDWGPDMPALEAAILAAAGKHVRAIPDSERAVDNVMASDENQPNTTTVSEHGVTEKVAESHQINNQVKSDVLAFIRNSILFHSILEDIA